MVTFLKHSVLSKVEYLDKLIKKEYQLNFFNEV